MQLPYRIISHFDLDSFFVSVECLKNNQLQGKPLLIGGKSDRAVVAACSYEARRFGIHSAMPMKLARRLCPHAIILQGDFENYCKFSDMVTDIISEKVPEFEKASIDEFYVNLTGMDKYFGCEKFTRELKQLIVRETGLPISYGISTNKLVSKVATDEAKPNGQLQIPFGKEKLFLAPLPVKKMPMIGEKTGEVLKRLGVRFIHTLAEMPIEMLESVLGKTGIELWHRANGIDDTLVMPYREQKGISTESTFETDTTNLDFLQRCLVNMVQKIAFELRQQNRLTGTVIVKIRYANFDTVTKQVGIPYTCSDHLLIPRIKHLFELLYNKRMLVRLIGVRFTHLIPGNHQINMFEDTCESIQLYQTIDNINRKYGKGAVVRSGGL
ncbi:MAG: DNA polymerase IV [Ferruginibacter sp.]|nr:DNA polymerase IV [Ferruginibacter sp.]